MLCLARLLLIWLALSATVASAFEESFTDEPQSMVQDAAALRRILDRPPPTGDDLKKLRDYYRDRDTAAWQLNLQDVRRANAEAWLAAMPPGELQRMPRWQLWSYHKKYGDRALGMRYGEEVVAMASGNVNPFSDRVQLAWDYQSQNNTKAARKLVKEAEQAFIVTSNSSLSIGQQADVARWKAGLYALQAAFARGEGQFAEADRLSQAAMESAKEALALVPQLGRRSRLIAYDAYIFAVGAVRSSYIARGKYREAELLLRDAIDAFRRGGAAAGVYSTLIQQAAQLRITQGRFEEAIKLADKGLKDLGEGINARTVSMRVTSLYATLGAERWAEASQIVDRLEADAAEQRALGYLLDNQPRGVVRLMNGAVERSLPLLKRAYDLALKKYGSDHYVVAQGKGLHAMALLKKAQAEGSATLEAQAANLLAQAVRGMTEPKGIPLGTESQGVYKVYRRLIFEAYLESLYPEMVNNAPVAVAEGFRIADILRSSSVQQAVVDAAVRAAVNVPGLGGLIRQMQDHQREIAFLYDEIAKQLTEPTERRNSDILDAQRSRLQTLEKELETLLTSIRQRFPEFDQLARPVAPDAAAVVRRLGPHEALLSVLPTSQRIYLWLVTDAGVHFAASQNKMEHIEDRVGRLRRTLDVASEARPPAVDAASAHALYQMLVEPVRKYAANRDQWSIVAGGLLSSLPFQTLLTRPGAVAPTSAPWLVRELAMAMTPTVAAWMSLRQLAPGSNKRKVLVGFGDPDFGGTAIAAKKTERNIQVARQDDKKPLNAELDALLETAALQYQSIPPLPETRDELLAIAKVLGADSRRDLYFGQSANRATVMKLNAARDLADRKVVMFATHGLIPGDLPGIEQPALALSYAGQNMNDSLLTLEDVLNLKLDADWVVLSACNTAAADGRNSEAISGLGRGFFYAGARALLLTHWAVESESAMSLTIATFGAYAANPASSRAQVLRQAQLKLLANPATAHPTYWAPFTLVGDGAR